MLSMEAQCILTEWHCAQSSQKFRTVVQLIPVNIKDGYTHVGSVDLQTVSSMIWFLQSLVMKYRAPTGKDIYI